MATPPLAPVPPGSPAPPLAPPSWPPHTHLVDPGVNTWPAEWFGNVSTTAYYDVEPAAWRGEPGVNPGYDFGLPTGTQPASRGLLTLARQFGVLPVPPTSAQALPTLAFAANAVFCLWCTWNQVCDG